MHPNSDCEVIHTYATRAPSWAPRAKSCDNWSADPIYYSCGAENSVRARLGISMQQTTAITMIPIIIRKIWICTIKRSQSYIYTILLVFGDDSEYWRSRHLGQRLWSLPNLTLRWPRSQFAIATCEV